MASPDGRSFVEGPLQWVAVLAVERFIEFGKVGQWPVDAELGGAVGVGDDTEARGLLPGEGPPCLSVAQEEPLLGGETFDPAHGGLALLAQLPGVPGDLEAAQVGDVLAQGELAVELEAGQ